MAYLAAPDLLLVLCQWYSQNYAFSYRHLLDSIVEIVLLSVSKASPDLSWLETLYLHKSMHSSHQFSL
jgi:hypothetical protein